MNQILTIKDVEAAKSALESSTGTPERLYAAAMEWVDEQIRQIMGDAWDASALSGSGLQQEACNRWNAYMRERYR